MGEKSVKRREGGEKKGGARFTVVEENEIRKRGKVPRARSGFDERRAERQRGADNKRKMGR